MVMFVRYGCNFAPWLEKNLRRVVDWPVDDEKCVTHPKAALLGLGTSCRTL